MSKKATYQEAFSGRARAGKGNAPHPLFGVSHLTRSVEETRQLGKRIAKTLQPGDMLSLFGDLGSGKTSLVQGIAEGLGIQEVVNSPTYIYIHPYTLPRFDFYHVDLYRAQDPEKIKNIGLEEIIFDPSNILVIEWPEIIQKTYPAVEGRTLISCTFKKTTISHREIVMQASEDARLS